MNKVSLCMILFALAFSHFSVVTDVVCGGELSRDTLQEKSDKKQTDKKQTDKKKQVYMSANKGKLKDTYWISVETEIDGVKLPKGALSLKFGPGNKIAYVAGPQVFKGTYLLKNNLKVELTFEKELAGKTVHTENISIKKNILTMTDSDGTSLDFKSSKFVKDPVTKEKTPMNDDRKPAEKK